MAASDGPTPERAPGGDIVTTSLFNVTLLEESLWVGSLGHDGLRACAWPLLKAMLGSPSDDGTGFFSFTHEEDGLTLIMDDRSYAAFEESSLIEQVTCAPHRWRAFEIHLGSLAWEVPGLVCFLSTIMAESRISILNLSTCDRDFVLVRECDVALATGVIRERLRSDVAGLKEAMEQHQQQRDSRSANAEQRAAGSAAEATRTALQLPREWTEAGDTASSEGAGASGAGQSSEAQSSGARPLRSSFESLSLAPAPNGHAAAAEGGEGGDAAAVLAGLSRSRSQLPEGPGMYIKVLPARLVVVRLQQGMLPPSTHALIKRLLFSSRGGGDRTSLWSYTRTEEEISLILDQEALDDFPPDAIVGSPSVWRAFKLCGRLFSFDETGVVSAMYAPYERGVPLLNISTFATNITLVEESEMERALDAFELPHIVAGDDDAPKP